MRSVMAVRWRWRSSTSTASRPSTTATAIRPATVLCARSPARLQRVLRKGDLLARVGGEEFAWILPEVHSHGAWAAVERARHAIADRPFDGVGRLTISIGVALRGELENGAELYEHADESLYRAKREGRNRSIMWRSV